MNSASKSNALGNERAFRFISYGLVFMLMVCVILNVSILIHSVLPEWHSGILAGAAVLVLIDRLYTYRQTKSLTPLSTEWAISVGAQWIVILLLIRLLLSSVNGLVSLRADLNLLARGYLAELFTPEYITCLLLAFLVWFLSGRFLDLIDEIYQARRSGQNAILILAGRDASDEAIRQRAKAFNIPVYSIATERDLKIWMQETKHL